MKRRFELLNWIIQNKNYDSYLEIGVEDPATNYNRIVANIKYGVDPCFVRSPAGPSFGGTSDEFFKQNKDKFDLIFIDGLHEAGQVYRDIENSFEVLNLNGTIVMHDCLPRSEVEQRVPREQDVWTGDVWKAFVRYRENHPYVKMETVNTDMGMGILTRSYKECRFKTGKELTYKNFVENCKEWLNLISVEEFLQEREGVAKCIRVQ